VIVALLVDERHKVALGASVVDLMTLPVSNDSIELCLPMALRPQVSRSGAVGSAVTAIMDMLTVQKEDGLLGPVINLDIKWISKKMDGTVGYDPQTVRNVLRKCVSKAKLEEWAADNLWLTSRLSTIDGRFSMVSDRNHVVPTGEMVMQGIKRADVAITALTRMMGTRVGAHGWGGVIGGWREPGGALGSRHSVSSLPASAGEAAHLKG
jgi:hypothetical protein